MSFYLNNKVEMEEIIGYRVAERYELTEILGTGSFGAVFKATDLKAGPQGPFHYAVKVLLKPESDSINEILLEREISLHERVTGHENVVGLHDVFRDDTRIFLLLDLAEAGTLKDVITKDKFYTAEDRDEKVKSLFLSILDGIEHCHKLGVYHRDLKPENILCSSDGKSTAIADFGLATDEELSDTFGCGTEAYISPEALDPRNPCPTTSPYCQDLWALGVILVNIIARRNPWNAATIDDLCFKAYLERPSYLYRVLDISNEVAELVIEMFEPNPFKRLHIQQIRQRVKAIRRFFKSSQEPPVLPPRRAPVPPPRRTPVPPPRHAPVPPPLHPKRTIPMQQVISPPPLPPRPIPKSVVIPVQVLDSDSTSSSSSISSSPLTIVSLVIPNLAPVRIIDSCDKYDIPEILDLPKLLNQGRLPQRLPVPPQRASIPPTGSALVPPPRHPQRAPSSRKAAPPPLPPRLTIPRPVPIPVALYSDSSSDRSSLNYELSSPTSIGHVTTDPVLVCTVNSLVICENNFENDTILDLQRISIKRRSLQQLPVPPRQAPILPPRCPSGLLQQAVYPPSLPPRPTISRPIAIPLRALYDSDSALDISGLSLLTSATLVTPDAVAVRTTDSLDKREATPRIDISDLQGTLSKKYPTQQLPVPPRHPQRAPQPQHAASPPPFPPPFPPRPSIQRPVLVPVVICSDLASNSSSSNSDLSSPTSASPVTPDSISVSFLNSLDECENVLEIDISDVRSITVEPPCSTLENTSYQSSADSPDLSPLSSSTTQPKPVPPMNLTELSLEAESQTSLTSYLNTWFPICANWLSSSVGDAFRENGPSFL